MGNLFFSAVIFNGENIRNRRISIRSKGRKKMKKINELFLELETAVHDDLL